MQFELHADNGGLYVVGNGFKIESCGEPEYVADFEGARLTE